MNLRETVTEQLHRISQTAMGRVYMLRALLDDSRDVREFMQLFTQEEINNFYSEFQNEIDDLFAEDEELLTVASVSACTQLALEKTLMLIEEGMKRGECVSVSVEGTPCALV